MKRVKCPLCNKESHWLGELKLNRSKTRYLVWGCDNNDDSHWAQGNIFLSDLDLNAFSMEKSDKIRDEIREEEMKKWEEIEL